MPCDIYFSQSLNFGWWRVTKHCLENLVFNFPEFIHSAKLERHSTFEQSGMYINHRANSRKYQWVKTNIPAAFEWLLLLRRAFSFEFAGIIACFSWVSPSDFEFTSTSNEFISIGDWQSRRTSIFLLLTCSIWNLNSSDFDNNVYLWWYPCLNRLWWISSSISLIWKCQIGVP